jgi:membrane-associated phospholipid phosphatase
MFRPFLQAKGIRCFDPQLGRFGAQIALLGAALILSFAANCQGTTAIDFCAPNVAGGLCSRSLVSGPTLAELGRPVDRSLLPRVADAAAPGVSRPPDFERPVSLRQLPLNILQDQKHIWTFGRFAHHHWKPLLGFALATGTLIVLDPYTEPYFRNSSGFSSFKTGALRGRNTTIAMVAVPAVMYVDGLVTGDTYAQHSALLSAEAIADVQVVGLVFKSISSRYHPTDIPPHGNFRDTWFKDVDGSWTNPGSFPSGHTLTAFAIASVLSHRYRNHRWVPFALYTGATLVGFSRVVDQAHFPSDVFAGAAIGYVIGHYVVLGGQHQH